MRRRDEGTQLLGLLRALMHGPAALTRLTGAEWTALLGVARAERMLGILAALAQDTGLTSQLPARVQTVFADAQIATARAHQRARWEAQAVAQALAGLGTPVVLLKGTAYVVAGLPCARGRDAGDVDILLPRSWLGAAEAALQASGWRLLAGDAYDEHYYRAWMHELPPMVHVERMTELDVHHTILPRTHRLTPDARALLAAAVPALPPGAAVDPGLAALSTLQVLSPADMVLHSAVHLFSDGDFDGALRNLWDIDQLLRHFSTQPDFWATLTGQASLHQLERPLGHAVLHCATLLGTPVPPDIHVWARKRQRWWLVSAVTRWAMARRFADAGRTPQSVSGRLARLLLLARSHWLKMPPLMLARHLWHKARKRRADSARAARQLADTRQATTPVNIAPDEAS